MLCYDFFNNFFRHTTLWMFPKMAQWLEQLQITTVDSNSWIKPQSGLGPYYIKTFFSILYYDIFTTIFIILYCDFFMTFFEIITYNFFTTILNILFYDAFHHTILWLFNHFFNILYYDSFRHAILWLFLPFFETLYCHFLMAFNVNV